MAPSFAPKAVFLETGEEVPVLVDVSTDVPPVLPLRWVVRTRRDVASANTIRADLYGVADLYTWGLARGDEFEDRLLAAVPLTPNELLSLIDYVREQPGRRPGTIARRLRSIEEFLLWAADPLNRGASDFVSPDELVLHKDRLHATFEPFLTGDESRRPEPLTELEDDALAAIVGPIRGPGGRIQLPVRFSKENPFRPATQVRNWLIYLLERGLGLRVSETLGLQLDDCPGPGRRYFVIRRRPDNPDDPRRRRPQVKGIEGLVDSNPVVDLALRLYTGDPRNRGRRTKGSPYLITATGSGRPLTISSVDKMWSRVAQVRPWLFEDEDGGSRLSSHPLRHTWAEEMARDLILNRKENKEIALDVLRRAGRWRDQSETPLHYIQNAIAEIGRQVQRHRVSTMYGINSEPDNDDE